MKYLTLIKDYFTFNRKEQRGITVLLVLIFLLIVANRVVPAFISKKPVDMSCCMKEVVQFEKSLAMAEQLERNKQGFVFRRQGTGFVVKDSSRKFPPREMIIIELNAADTFDLQQLRGIGPGFARRIVKYRDRLGGFIDVDQVKEVFGMDEARFKSIKASLRVDPSSVKPLDINNISFKELLAHPYFPFGITKGIMIYRKDHKVFRNKEELRTIPGICDSIFKKIRPYISIR